MGCDIHLYVERRQPDGTWASADNWLFVEEEDDDGNLVQHRTLWTWREGREHDHSFYNKRFYALFEILAGVRAYEGFVQLDAPRGVPDDASPEYLEMVRKWNLDGHSHSYCTVQELLDYDWTQTLRREGYLDLFDWADAKLNNNTPKSWCRSAGGGTIYTVTAAEINAAWREVEKHGFSLWDLKDRDRETLKRLVETLNRRNRKPKGSPFVSYTWEQPYYECVGPFWAKTMPCLLALGNPKDTRVVFFFDN